MGFAKEYETDRIRNVAVLGHGSSGKTSLVDALCFTAGTSRRRGSVEEGHALTITTPEEVAHGISIQVTPAFAEFMDTKINFLDTPGYMDFTGEALAAARVADGAVITVSATSGVEVGTEKVWRYCDDRSLSRVVFVSMMDKEHADFDGAFRSVKERLSESAVPVEIPIGAGPEFRGIVNLFTGRAHIYREGTQTGEYDEQDIPEEVTAEVERWTTELQESLATTDESLLERYLDGQPISREESVDALARAMARGELVPVLCGSSRTSYGTRALLQKIVELLPNPGELPGEKAHRRDLDQEVILHSKEDGPFVALVFKTASEPHVGELSFFRIFSGSVVNGMEVENARTGVLERLNHLSIPQGKDRLEVARLHAGDMGVVAKLKDTHTNDTLCSSGRAMMLEGITFPQPDIAVAVRGATRHDEDKLGEVLQKLHEEDPVFLSEYNSEFGQTIVRGLGELHLDVQLERMERKYGVKVETEQPKIAYRETLTRVAEGHGRFKKQTGGRGQFGDCRVRLLPRGRGEGYEFIDSIKGGVIPGKYVPSVDKGIQEASQKGILAGYPVVDFAAECYDGSYHSVDSSDIAFKVAGSLAFQKVSQMAGPILLEPIMEVMVTTPDEFLGDVMGDITQRRGKVQGMEPAAGRTVIRARVPEAELYKYANALRSMTQGRAHHTRTMVGYEPVPDHIAQGLIEEAKERNRD